MVHSKRFIVESSWFIAEKQFGGLNLKLSYHELLIIIYEHIAATMNYQL